MYHKEGTNRRLWLNRSMELSIDDVGMENGPTFSCWKLRRTQTCTGKIGLCFITIHDVFCCLMTMEGNFVVM